MIVYYKNKKTAAPSSALVGLALKIFYNSRINTAEKEDSPFHITQKNLCDTRYILSTPDRIK